MRPDLDVADLSNRPDAHPQTGEKKLLKAGTYRFRIRVALAPFCLCMVAMLHFSRVHWSQQTPWKGGGFGMFSTVDARAARYLKLYLVTENGEVPVRLPASLRKRANRLRAAPSEEKLRSLAQRLVSYEWYSERQRWASVATSIDGQTTQPPDRETPLDPSEVIPVAGAGAADGDLKAVSPQEAAARHFPTFQPQGVRVELWRYRFDSRPAMLLGQKYLETESEDFGKN